VFLLSASKDFCDKGNMRAALLAAMVMLLGCEPKTVEQPVSPEESWKAAAAKLEAVIKPGMTKKEVLAAAGQPTEQKTVLSGEVVEVWHYAVAPKIYLKVQFNRSDRVINTQLDSEYKTGG